MNYSRRQLEALGETLGECVTRKEGGRIIYGSGGGGSSSAPTTQTQVVDLPDWAKPTAQKTLARAEGLADAPYQRYDQPRIAGFSPLQLQAQQGAAGMTTAPQLGAASNIAQQAAMRGLGAQYQPGEFGNQFFAPEAYQPAEFGMVQAQAPQLQQFQMGPAERAQTQSFVQPGAAESYMSPFMQNVIDKQTREAERQAGLAAQQRRAQAIQQRAFGGARSAITEAAAARDLARLQNEIYGTGQQAAFQSAQQQFNQEQQARLQAQLANQQAGLTVGGQNLAALLGVQQLGAGQNLQAQLANQQAFQAAQQAREQSRQFGAGQGMTAAQQQAQFGQAAQQLGEQSRQFGAGLGLQGAQAALTGAGQLGNLGQTEFGQTKDILGLQQQFGAQQQALRQQGLSQAYQDFLNEQNYPYRQLGFLSDMIRGLPLGQQSTSQVYQPPANLMGQLGGIGMGLYGLSRGFAGGGEVQGYADGGSVDAPENVSSIVSRLSDQQLAQAEQAAQARGDYEQMQAIMVEKGMRASERNGLAGAFNKLPYDSQEQMMAGGGIVAFANGGMSPEFDVGDPTAEGVRSINPLDIGRRLRGGKSIAEYYKEPAPVAPAPAPVASDASYDRLESRRLAQARPAAPARAAVPKEPKISSSITAAATKMADEAGLDRGTFLQQLKDLTKQFDAESKEEMKGLLAEAQKSMGGSKEVKEKALGRALAEFGFNWAAAASKPGAKFFGSAAAASPTLAASMAESAKLAREMDQNDLKLQMNLKQFEIAQRKDDRKTALSAAAQIRALEQNQAQLALKRQELAQQGAYQQAALRQRGEQTQALTSLRGLTAAAQLQNAKVNQEKLALLARQKWEEGPGRMLERQLAKDYGKNWASQAEAQAIYNQKKNAFMFGETAVAQGAIPYTAFMSGGASEE